MNRPNPGAVLGWGLFGACSWTWCIGLYVPVILIRTFGWSGFIVFAIPNVIGAAAVGYVVNKARSAGLVRRHRAAMRWFSLAAIAFHTLFMPIFAASFVLPAPDALGAWSETSFGLLLAGVVYVTALGVSAVPTRLWPWVALGTYAISLVAFVQWGAAGWSDVRPSADVDGSALIWLAPVIALGFVLCPYLDLTFHRAIHESPSRHAFAIFGVAFTVMILFTAAYAGAEAITPLVMYHVLVQSIFTAGAHMRELWHAREPRPSGPGRLGGLLLPILAAMVYPLAMTLAGDGAATLADEVYLRYLGLFGLVFPAYVLVFMVRGVRVERTPGTRLAFVVAMVLAVPCFELGFIHGRTWALTLPVAAAVVWAVLRAGRSGA